MLEAYLKSYKTHWDKPVQEFVVDGEWAFERYAYKSTNMPLADGPVVEDTGWGLVIYHQTPTASGAWRPMPLDRITRSRPLVVSRARKYRKMLR